MAVTAQSVVTSRYVDSLFTGISMRSTIVRLVIRDVILFFKKDPIDLRPFAELCAVCDSLHDQYVCVCVRVICEVLIAIKCNAFVTIAVERWYYA